jgi:hypothetical protein
MFNQIGTNRHFCDLAGVARDSLIQTGNKRWMPRAAHISSSSVSMQSQGTISDHSSLTPAAANPLQR